MKVQILGICGTFMAGVAALAKQAGHEVVGCDQNVYPPMSTQLASQKIILQQGYDAENLHADADIVVVGNAMKRGYPIVEALLNSKIPYVSGPEWLSKNILQDRWVLGVAGTHGKTTTSCMLAWILEFSGLNPGFLIGGIPENFDGSARVGSSPFFVIESDEYDSAFFDKRSKFFHYHPNTLVLNNLEFDHADIFSDLEAIKKQFHHLIRTIPSKGQIIFQDGDKNLQSVFDKGCWTPQVSFGIQSGLWKAENISDDGSQFDVVFSNQSVGTVNWSLLGQHNIENALAAIAAAHHAGIAPQEAVCALRDFKGVKRRLEVRGKINDVTVYDDFAHHPTAIETTLKGLRAHVGKERIIAVLEFGSHTMRLGAHKSDIWKPLSLADEVIFRGDKGAQKAWGIKENKHAKFFTDVNQIVDSLKETVMPGDHVLIMSNSGFEDVHEKLLNGLAD